MNLLDSGLAAPGPARPRLRHRRPRPAAARPPATRRRRSGRSARCAAASCGRAPRSRRSARRPPRWPRTSSPRCPAPTLGAAPATRTACRCRRVRRRPARTSRRSAASCACSPAPRRCSPRPCAPTRFALGHAVLALLGAEWGADVDVEAALAAAHRAAGRADERERRFVEVADRPRPRARARRRRPRCSPTSTPIPRTRSRSASPCRRSRSAARPRSRPRRGRSSRGWRRLRRRLVVPRAARVHPAGAGALRRGRRARRPRARGRAGVRARGARQDPRALRDRRPPRRAGLAGPLDRDLRRAGLAPRALLLARGAARARARRRRAAARAGYAAQLAPPAVTASGPWSTPRRCCGAVYAGRRVAARSTSPPCSRPCRRPAARRAADAVRRPARGGRARRGRRLRRPGPAAPVAPRRAGRRFADTVAPLADALRDLVHGDPDRATDALLALRGVERLGGSAAQREIVEETLILCARGPGASSSPATCSPRASTAALAARRAPARRTGRGERVGAHYRNLAGPVSSHPVRPGWTVSPRPAVRGPAPQPHSPLLPKGAEYDVSGAAAALVAATVAPDQLSRPRCIQGLRSCRRRNPGS